MSGLQVYTYFCYIELYLLLVKLLLLFKNVISDLLYLFLVCNFIPAFLVLGSSFFIISQVCDNTDNPLSSFDSITEDDDAPIMNIEVTNLFSVAMALRKKAARENAGDEDLEVQTRAKANWKKLLKASQTRGDPWANFCLDELPVENAVRYRYNALRKSWREEKVVVKIEKETFGKGAMRECFRM